MSTIDCCAPLTGECGSLRDAFLLWFSRCLLGNVAVSAGLSYIVVLVLKTAVAGASDKVPILDVIESPSLRVLCTMCCVRRFIFWIVLPSRHTTVVGDRCTCPPPAVLHGVGS